MKQFKTEILHKINTADDLKISPLRADGKTYGTPTWIWEVVVEGELYVRAYNGTMGRWYQSAIQQKAGQIHAAGMVKDVVFEAANNKEELQSKIDAAYREKYSNSPYLGSMIREEAKAATVKISPQ
ncbi:DUF2255 family protein [Paenimyroides aestuarii]|uniref:DUF2255 family protein n=1 Tax=Paenimyroides aestuarii TaxID=2968490 RepID=A0ABY5NV02_9FLAO|nr:DUF2255 family protein [Paenimyroides aestuarii]UUV22391.1 DUF2255 family protein [Paenimyroides aestuarii]